MLPSNSQYLCVCFPSRQGDVDQKSEKVICLDEAGHSSCIRRPDISCSGMTCQMEKQQKGYAVQ